MFKNSSIYIFLGLLFSCFTGFSQSDRVQPAFLEYQQHSWVDSIMRTLTPNERVAQLIMVAAYSNKGRDHEEELLKLVEEQKIGGLLFFQGGPIRQARMINQLQAASKVPLLGAIDAEWGLGMRLDNTIRFPYQMTLGAIQDESLIYYMGVEIARQIKRTGLHLNFAPVVDVNNNANNPVINYRSFGEDKMNVASKSIAYMRGMQDHNLMTTAKHFPGHGDTDTDSHYALPQINHTRARLDSLELYPFKELIKAGIGGVMVAHLNIPALDTSRVASTLSRSIITDLLKNELGFEGLTVTDAMNMKGVTKGNLPGVVDKDAILAGNDLLEFTEDVPKAIAEIRNAIDMGIISQEEIDKRCRKILAVKYWVGLHKLEPIATSNMLDDLNTEAAQVLNRKLTEASITVLKNENDMLPVLDVENLKIASISIGADKKTTFQKSLDNYAEVSHFHLKNEASKSQLLKLQNELFEESFDVVIIGIHDDSRFPRNTIKLNKDVKEYLEFLIDNENSLVSYFKNPYSIDKLPALNKTKALILTYQDNENAQEVAAQVIFGGIGANGKLPISIGETFKAGEGLDIYFNEEL